ncbi:MAG: hypothetical protein SOZ59_00385 [Candidatus Limivivens sp.]|nr:hypothetical protein [Candidatus Limivivens sp.]
MNKMILDRVPRQFCEGPFWGNGKMGTVLYIKDQALYFSIDHAALWELRETLPDEPRATFAEILKHRKKFLDRDPAYVEQTDIFANAFGRTRLPALGVSMELSSDVEEFLSETDLFRAESELTMRLKDGSSLKAQIWLDSCVNVLNVELAREKVSQIFPKAKGWDLELPSLKVLKNWHYPPCLEEQEGNRFCMEQGYGGERTAILIGDRTYRDGRMNFTVTILTGLNVETERLKREGNALLDAYIFEKEIYREAHVQDWKKFWETSSVEVPNGRLQEAYEQELYKIYCNERPDSMPVTLQGIWNPNNRMPAWYGDLHNDLNVESCYWAAFKTGHAELARSYIEYYAGAIPRFQERAKKLFQIEGAVHIPTMMAPDGTGSASEWCYWNTILGAELFVATDFCWFYEYTKDLAALREKIMPLLKGVIHLYQSIAYEGEDGCLHIPFTTSPEVRDEEGMMHRDDATFTLSVLHYLLDRLKEYSVLCGEPEDTAVWEEFDRKLAPVKTNEKGYPLFAGQEVFGSHRHFCHLFPIFPLGTDTHSEVAEQSLDTVVNQGFLEYAAFSFPYMGIFAARCGRGNMARTMLELYCMCFRSRNSLTVNGDPYQNGLLRISDTNAGESSDAFTLESGLIVPAAICEMFVHRSRNTLWLLYGIPDEWKECSCRSLAVEGNHRVSVTQKNYRIAQAELIAGCEEKLRICWKGKEALKGMIWNGKVLPADQKGSVEIALKKNDRLKLLFAV